MTERLAPLSNYDANDDGDEDSSPVSHVSPSVATTAEHVYPEGGYGWIVLAATFVCTFWYETENALILAGSKQKKYMLANFPLSPPTTGEKIYNANTGA